MGTTSGRSEPWYLGYLRGIRDIQWYSAEIPWYSSVISDNWLTQVNYPKSWYSWYPVLFHDIRVIQCYSMIFWAILAPFVLLTTILHKYYMLWLWLLFVFLSPASGCMVRAHTHTHTHTHTQLSRIHTSVVDISLAIYIDYQDSYEKIVIIAGFSESNRSEIMLHHFLIVQYLWSTSVAQKFSLESVFAVVLQPMELGRNGYYGWIQRIK